MSSNYVYLANGTDGLRVYDVTDPTHPMNIGHTNIFYGSDVAVSGNRVYLDASGLRIFDVSTPSVPVQIGYTNLIYVNAIAVSGSSLYVARSKSDGGLGIYDVSNPEDIVNLSTIDEGSVGIAVSGDYLYLANWTDGLSVYDVSNPSNPVNVGHIDDGDLASDVAVSGHYICLANSDDGLRIYAVMPQLTISANAGDVAISWPAPAPFTLQQSPDPFAAVWYTVTNAPVAVGSSNQVILAAPTENTFFKLISQ